MIYIAKSPPVIEFLQSNSNTANLSTYTFVGENIGAADPTRYIAICVSTRTASSISSISVGGVPATIVSQVTNSANTAGIAIIAVPTGTSADVEVVWNVSTACIAMSLYRITNLDNPIAFDIETSTAANPSVSLDIPNNGIALGLSMFQNVGSMAWSGLTENTDITVDSLITHSCASDVFPSAVTGQAIQATHTSALRPILITASWS